MFNFYNQNPYFNPYFNAQPQQVPPTPMRYNTGLQGKSIDNLEVVKAMDIPLDGSISYFPLTDGSAIRTKQVQTEVTSKTVIYKPSDDKDKEINDVTPEELDKAIKKIDLTDIKDDIKSIKKQIKDLRDSDE